MTSAERIEITRAAENERRIAGQLYKQRFGSMVVFPHILSGLSYSSLLTFAVRKSREFGVDSKGRRLGVSKLAWLLCAWSITQSMYNQSGMFNRIDVFRVFEYSRLRHGHAFRYWENMGFIEQVGNKDVKRWTWRLTDFQMSKKPYYIFTEEGKKFIQMYYREFNRQLDHFLSYGDSYKELMQHEHTSGYLYKILSWFNHDRDKFMRNFVDDDGELTHPIDLKVKDLKKHAKDWLKPNGTFSKERLNKED